MTFWKSNTDLKEFASSGAHLEAMKKGVNLAKEIRTLTIEADALPNWQEAINLLEKNGRCIKY